MIHQKNTFYAFEEEFFESLHGLTLCVEEPAPDPQNPILEEESGKIYYPASLAARQGGYGLWYLTENKHRKKALRFARSDDGWNWQCGRGVDLPGGLDQNTNNFLVHEKEGRFLAPIGALEFLQPEQFSDLRLKVLAENQIRAGGRRGISGFAGVATSDDGLHWEMPQTQAMIPMKVETPRLCHFQGRYILNGQTNGVWFDPSVASGRIVVFFESADLNDWRLHADWMSNSTGGQPGDQIHCGIVPIKCIDDRILLGLGGRFDPATELPHQHWDITLLYSYDGIHWKPVASPDHAHRSWIRRGRGGEWDFGGVVGIGMVEREGQAAVYYSATSIGNLCHTSPLYDPGPCAVGRVLFAKDRFAALQPVVGWQALAFPENAPEIRGIALTKPLLLSQDRPLSLNLEIPEKESTAALVVELVREDGTVHSTTEVTQSGLNVSVRPSQPVPAKPMRLRFTFRGGCAPDRVPRLFSVQY